MSVTAVGPDLRDFSALCRIVPGRKVISESEAQWQRGKDTQALSQVIVI